MAQTKVLDLNGLDYLMGKLDTEFENKVDKVNGKVLSSNDYTNAEKSKLSGVAAGAQANVVEGVKVNGTALVPTAKVVNIDLSTYALKSEISSVYRVKGSITYADMIALTNGEVGDVWNVTDRQGANYVCTVAGTAGAGSWDMLGSTVDLSNYYTKTQVDSALAGKANSSSLAIVATSGSYNDLTNKPTIPAAITVDSALSGSSTNPVQNKIVKEALDLKLASADLVAISNAEIDALFA